MIDERSASSIVTEWVVIGTGNVGQTLCALAPLVGARVAATWSHTRSFNAGAPHFIGSSWDDIRSVLPKKVVFLSVTDDHIAEVAEHLLPNLNDASAVFHLSGMLPSTILKDVGVTAPVASIHPVLSIANPETALPKLSDAFWSLEGDEHATAIGHSILQKINVTPATISAEHKTLYHCSAVMAAGHVVTLLDAALNVAQLAGLSREQARGMLLTLAESSLLNIRESTTKDALTGPVARNDASVIAAHATALKNAGELEIEAIYKLLADYEW